MTTFAVLATGPSMSQTVAETVRGRCKVIAVSDAYRLAPWADALVSTDAKWWKHHADALKFAGEKWSAAPSFVQQHEGIRRFLADSHTNSGLLAMMVAQGMGAKRILMLGFDLGGAHFFGAHPAPLKNTTPDRFEAFKRQFQYFQPRGVDIVNVTPGSALNCYRRSTLEAELEGMAEPASQ